MSLRSPFLSPALDRCGCFFQARRIGAQRGQRTTRAHATCDGCTCGGSVWPAEHRLCDRQHSRPRCVLDRHDHPIHPSRPGGRRRVWDSNFCTPREINRVVLKCDSPLHQLANALRIPSALYGGKVAGLIWIRFAFSSGAR